MSYETVIVRKKHGIKIPHIYSEDPSKRPAGRNVKLRKSQSNIDLATEKAKQDLEDAFKKQPDEKIKAKATQKTEEARPQVTPQITAQSATQKELIFDKVMSERQWKTLYKDLVRFKDASLSSGKDYKYVHDYYLLNIAWMTGLRVSEVSGLDWGDISTEQWLKVREGKGAKARIVYFGKKTEKLFSEYKSFKQMTLRLACYDDEAIFVGIRGDRLGRVAMHYRMKFWVKTAGLSDKLSFHSLRHGFATRMLNQGIKLHDVKDILGHSNIATTSVYLHFTEESREAFRRVL